MLCSRRNLKYASGNLIRNAKKRRYTARSPRRGRVYTERIRRAGCCGKTGNSGSCLIPQWRITSPRWRGEEVVTINFGLVPNFPPFEYFILFKQCSLLFKFMRLQGHLRAVFKTMRYNPSSDGAPLTPPSQAPSKFPRPSGRSVRRRTFNPNRGSSPAARRSR